MNKNQLLFSCVFTCSCCVLGSLIHAQTFPPKQWDKDFGGTDDDVLQTLQTTKDGGYILGGYSYSIASGNKSESTHGVNDFWVVKINSKGTKQWEKSYGGTGGDEMYSLQKTKDGGYILGGYSNSDIGGDKTQASRGGNDYWIMKIDGSGNKQWDKCYGGSYDDELYSLQQTKDGGFILGGYSNSDSTGDKTQNNKGTQYSYDYWVVKIDSSGTKQWDKSFGGTSSDYLSSIQQTTDGGYILGGYSLSGMGGDKTQNSRGARDYWVVKIDRNGIKKWDKRFGGNDEDYLNALQQTMDGGYILGGESSSGISGDKTKANFGFAQFVSDFWVVKIDAKGIKQWDSCYGGNGYDGILALRQTRDTGYIFAGHSSSDSSGAKTETDRGYDDYWVVKTDVSGKKQWDKRFGGTGGDELTAVAETTDGEYILGGYSPSGINGDKTDTCWGTYDYWVVKMGCPPNNTVTASGNLDICNTDSIILNAYVATGVKYQWLKNNKKIVGATDSSYTAKTPGKYKVIVYTTECADTSKAVMVTTCDSIAQSPIKIFPNPSNGSITINYQSGTTEDIHIAIVNRLGKMMLLKAAKAFSGNNVYSLNLKNAMNGLYQVQIITKSSTRSARFIIEN